MGLSLNHAGRDTPLHLDISRPDIGNAARRYRPQSSEAAIWGNLVPLYCWIAVRQATPQRNNGGFSLLKQRKQAMYYSVSGLSE